MSESKRPGRRRHRRTFGTIEERKSSFYVKYMGPDGVRHYAPHPFTSRLNAETFLLNCQNAIAAGDWTPGFGQYAAAGPTVQELLERYQTDRSKPLSPLTAVDYSKLARTRILPGLGRTPAEDLTRTAVKDWVRSLDPSTSRTNAKALALLSAVLQYGVNEELLERNVAKGVAMPKSTRKRDKREMFIPSQKFGEYLGTVKEYEPAWFPMLATDLLTGLRSGELRGLKVSDLELDKQELHVRRQVLKVRDPQRPGSWVHVLSDDTKTAAGERTVSLPAFLCEILRQYLRDFPKIGGALLFPNADGHPMNSDVLLRAHYRVTERMGLRTPASQWETTPASERVHGPRVHDLRASASTWLAEQGATIPELMARFGWKTPAMATTVYARANKEREQRFMQEQDAALRAAMGESQ